jgi:arylsulfatase A-like enzyme
LNQNNLDHQEHLKEYYELGIEKFDKLRINTFFDKLVGFGFDLKNDLIIILSDHGEGRTDFQNSSNFGHGSHLTEETLRISLFVNQNLKINKSNLFSIKDIKQIILDLINERSPNIKNNNLYAEHHQSNISTILQGKENDRLGVKNIGNIKSYLSEQAYINKDFKLIANNSQNLYSELFNKDIVNDNLYIEKLYNILLNRYPDEAGSINFLRIIKNKSRTEVLKNIMNSSEFKSRSFIDLYKIHQLLDILKT